MARHKVIVLAGALLLTGCMPEMASLQTAQQPAAKEQRVLTAVPAVASEATFNALQNAGLYVMKRQQGDTVTVTGSTTTGNHFTLYFERNPSDGTAVHIEWERDADPVFWERVLKILDTVQENSGAATAH
jgi:hypothetical protein